MENFVDRYCEKVAMKESILCVGLDPTIEHVPPKMRSGDAVADIERYLFNVIDIASPMVPVIKPQIAYYSALGKGGEEMLERLISYAHSRGLLVILDAKRSDIGKTMEKYGEEVFERYKVDACTFVPYLGLTFDPSWIKWLQQGRMVISMIRTSNPEAVILQDEELKDGKLVYEYIAWLVARWNAKVAEKTKGKGSVGGVVGATWPEETLKCRQIAGDEVFFLIPGYGAQGGGADVAVSGLLNSHGKIMGTVNNSRGITLYSWWDKIRKRSKEGNPFDLIRAEIQDSNNELITAANKLITAANI
ncbi:MAG: orotidine-5'-phosphate decarboxylase [Patescibacteria group bacterium]|nr:orotidine-5'-phosphate decarboxylase [Patescibacteria group bacterium]